MAAPADGSRLVGASPASEFDLIEAFRAPFEAEGRGLILGPGDDCAVFRPSPGMELCATVDAAVDGVHFKSETFFDAEIGHKALAMNLSDLAAMGASPRFFLCSVSCPKERRFLARLPAIACGMADLARACGALLIGGNFTCADTLAFHITALGEVPAGQSLCRSGAGEGDILAVSGALGGAAFGLAELERSGRDVPACLRVRQCTPMPRHELGAALRPLASAAMDISDGLLQDAGHLAERSRVHLEIRVSDLPLDPMLTQSGLSPADCLRMALTGGEDYELLLTIPPENWAAAEEEACALGLSLTAIGRAVGGSGGVLLTCLPRGLSADELTVRGGSAGGFDHFRGASGFGGVSGR